MKEMRELTTALINNMNFEVLPKNIEQSPEAEEIEDELDVQEEGLKKEVSQKGYGKLAKIARKFAFTGVMLLPAFAAGCGAVEKPATTEKPAAESKDGFLDNTHEVVKQRLKIRRDEIESSHDIQRRIKESTLDQKAAAKQAVEDMKKPMINQDL